MAHTKHVPPTDSTLVATTELQRLKELATVIARSRDDSGVRELCARICRLGSSTQDADVQ